MCETLHFGTSQHQTGAVWPAPSKLGSRALGRLLGIQEGCCNVNCKETHWQSLLWKCFFRAAAVCSCSSEVSPRISVKGKKLLTSGQWYRSLREQQWQLHHLLGEGIPLLGALLGTICKAFSFSAQLLVCTVTCS